MSLILRMVLKAEDVNIFIKVGFSCTLCVCMYVCMLLILAAGIKAALGVQLPGSRYSPLECHPRAANLVPAAHSRHPLRGEVQAI